MYSDVIKPALDAIAILGKTLEPKENEPREFGDARSFFVYDDNDGVRLMEMNEGSDLDGSTPTARDTAPSALLKMLNPSYLTKP